MKITERRVVEQEWYETCVSKTGWETLGWVFKDSEDGFIDERDWRVVDHLETDKYYNPIMAIAEKETEI